MERSRRYLALRAFSTSGEAGVRLLSNGPPGANRISPKARKLITSSSGTRKARRFRKYIGRRASKFESREPAASASWERSFARFDFEATVESSGLFCNEFH